MAKKKVLLIDFDSEFVKFLSKLLSDIGYEIFVASDGLAGFEKFNALHPDLVIMEAMLPKFHGFELCSRITSNPLKRTPVIIVTAIYKDAVYKTEALCSLGASAFFEKPVNPEPLLNKVIELIGKPETKKTASRIDQDLDKLIEEALAITTSVKEPAEKIKRPEKPQVKEEPVRKTIRNKDQEEVDLILEAKLKDLISETPIMESKPASAPAARIDKQPLTSKPAEEKKAVKVTPPAPPLNETLKKTVPPAQPAAQKKTEPVRPEPKPEPEPVPKIEVPPAPRIEPAPAPRIQPKSEPKIESKLEIKVEPRPEPKIESRAEARVESRPVPRTEPKRPPVSREERPASVSVPAVHPFKGLIEEEEKPVTRKKSSGKFIGIAAAALVIIAAASFLLIKKKDVLTFFKQPGNQVAALKTVGSPEQSIDFQEQPAAQPSSEEDLQKEIQEQIATYRSQKAQKENISKKSPAKNNKASGPAGSTNNRAESAVAPVVLPKETPQIDMNLNASQKQGQNRAAESGTVTAEKTEAQETAGLAEEKKSEEQPVMSPTQKTNPGDLVPLSAVDVEPKIVKSVEPLYPDSDRRLGIKGNIILNVLISENGDVLDAAVIRGIKGSMGLEREAINAVKKWKFLPAEKEGVKVKVWKPIAIGFGTK